MKKLYQISIFYAVIAMAGGVFYREFTKFNAFTDRTSLGFIHTHAFMLGMFFFLLLLLFEKQYKLTEHKRMTTFLTVYNAGLCLTILMLFLRGITQVKAIELSNAATATISGFAGIGHILLGIGFLYFFIILKEQLHLK